MEKKKMIRENFTCKHDYKNAIQIGSVDYVCPLCKQVLDPLEWFLMNSFEFEDVVSAAERRPAEDRQKKKARG
jgi:hypothetical protein